MRKHLSICIQIEEVAAKIYRSMINSPHLSGAVRQALSELANEEDEHATQLRFALRFPADTVVTSCPEMLAQADKLLMHSQRIEAKVANLGVDDKQAVAVGIELEKSFCQAHLAQSFKFKDETYREMFAAMARSDEEHCQRLLQLQQTINSA